MYILSLLFIFTFATGCNQTETISEVSPIPSAAETLLVYGDVRVDTTSQLLIDFPAKVEEVKVHNGDIVQQGDVLLTLDYSDYLFEIENKERLIHAYEVELKGLGANINYLSSNLSALQEELSVLEDYKANHSNPEIATLESTLKTQEDELALLKQTYTANKALFDAGALAAYELDISKQAYETLESQIATTKNSMKQIETQQDLKISALKSEIQSTQLQSQNTDASQSNEIELLKIKLETAKAELAQMKSKLSKPYLKDHALVAPSARLIISDLNCTNGTYINGLSTPILRTLSQDSLYISADIPEESLSLVKVGMTASIVPADSSLKPITGKVTSLSEEAILKDGDTMIEAKIAITSDKTLLKPGLTVDITLPLEYN